MAQDTDSLLEFPCDFPIKVIGKPGLTIDTLVFSLVRAHAPDLGEGAIRSRSSRGGKYQSVTVTVRATDREQLDRIYRALTAHEDIQMVL